MADNEIFAALTQYGFAPVNENVCVGVWRGYAVTLQKFAGQAYYVYLAVRLGKAQVKPLKKALTAAVKASGIQKAGLSRVMPNFVHAYLNFDKAGGLQGFVACMETLTAALAQNGAAPANTCAVTGAPNPDSLCLVTDANCFGYQPVCGAAVRQSGYEVQAKAEENENNGSYLTGFLGALLGMIAGVAVNLLTIVFLERIFTLLFALVPLAAMFGYKLFKGKTDKLAIVIVLVLSVLAVPLMEFLTLSIGLAREYSAPLSDTMRYTADVFLEPEILEEILPDMGKMLLFMALGVLIAWTYLRGQLNANRVQGARLQLDSMRPNPNYQPQQAYQAAQQVPEPSQQTYEAPQQ